MIYIYHINFQEENILEQFEFKILKEKNMYNICQDKFQNMEKYFGAFYCEYSNNIQHLTDKHKTKYTTIKYT